MTWWIPRLATLLVDYCTSVKTRDEVMIQAGLDAVPLVRSVYIEVVKRGGYPRFLPMDEVLQEALHRYAPDELLEYESPIDEFMMRNVDVRISIVSGLHTKPLVGVDPERIQKAAKARRKLVDIFMERDGRGELRWVVSAYPSASLAQEAGMGPLEFEDFVVKALKLDREDPVSEWARQAEWQERIANLLQKIDEIRVVSDNTDLLVKVSGRKWINDDGKKNMPGGEVFTGPVEDSVEGYVEFEYPSLWRGIEVEGIRLVFKRGEVVEAKARKGEDALRKLLEVDEGARRLGEFAFGLNYDITRHTKIILFDEKMGGTMHMALGAAYPATGGVNKSSIHWDIVKDLRHARVYGDGDLIYENGRFIEDLL